MRIFFFLIAVAVASAAGLFFYPHSLLNAILLGTVAYLVIEVAKLRHRITLLEQQSAPTPATAEEAPLVKTVPDVLRKEEAPVTRNNFV